MPFGNFLPMLPLTTLEIIMNVVAGLGAILFTYAIFLEAERRQDAVFIIGSACLLVYALWIGNTIFTIAMSGVLISSTVELIEILTGHHHHNPIQVDAYKHPEK